jgi:cell wall-associated NlpC family hydrolase
MDRDALIDAAKGMIGTPFHAQGRAPGVGLDCVGLVICAARAAGFEPEDRAAYPMRPDGTLQPSMEQQLQRVSKDQLLPGDVLLMAMSGTQPHHVALYVGNHMIIHAYAQARKVVMQTYTDFWQQKVVAAYRFPEGE